MKLKKYDKAINVFKELIGKCGSDIKKGEIFLQLGNAELLKGKLEFDRCRFREAKPYLEQACSYYGKISSVIEDVAILNNYIVANLFLYSTSSKLGYANVQLIETSMEIFNTFKTKYSQLSSEREFHSIFLNMGNFLFQYTLENKENWDKSKVINFLNEVEKLYSEALNYDALNTKVMYNLASVNYHLGKINIRGIENNYFDSALEYLIKAICISRETDNIPKTYYRLLSSILVYSSPKTAMNVVKLFLKFGEKTKDKEKIKNELIEDGDTEYNCGNYRKAKEVYEEALIYISSSKERASLFQEIARCCQRFDCIIDAEKSLLRAVELDYTNFSYYRNLGELYDKKGELTKALQMYLNCLFNRPTGKLDLIRKKDDILESILQVLLGEDTFQNIQDNSKISMDILVKAEEEFNSNIIQGRVNFWMISFSWCLAIERFFRDLVITPLCKLVENRDEKGECLPIKLGNNGKFAKLNMRFGLGKIPYIVDVDEIQDDHQGREEEDVKRRRSSQIILIREKLGGEEKKNIGDNIRKILSQRIDGKNLIDLRNDIAHIRVSPFISKHICEQYRAIIFECDKNLFQEIASFGSFI
ncbi:MAG: hypothetical protein K8T10_15920 [Candidatus Eremiobacteraeota bacterium]|nr:hypothetical protein [Candidatus Eremiobacteraeota bacterium]